MYSTWGTFSSWPLNLSCFTSYATIENLARHFENQPLLGTRSSSRSWRLSRRLFFSKKPQTSLERNICNTHRSYNFTNTPFNILLSLLLLWDERTSFIQFSYALRLVNSMSFAQHRASSINSFPVIQVFYNWVDIPNLEFLRQLRAVLCAAVELEQKVALALELVRGKIHGRRMFTNPIQKSLQQLQTCWSNLTDNGRHFYADDFVHVSTWHARMALVPRTSNPSILHMTQLNSEIYTWHPKTANLKCKRPRCDWWKLDFATRDCFLRNSLPIPTGFSNSLLEDFSCTPWHWINTSGQLTVLLVERMQNNTAVTKMVSQPCDCASNYPCAKWDWCEWYHSWWASYISWWILKSRWQCSRVQLFIASSY